MTGQGNPIELIFYIAPDGSDANDGRSPEQQGGGVGPLASLAAARDAIRAARGRGKPGPFIVEARGGWYVLDEPFTLTPEDSGTAAAPTVYRAFAGEQPIFSGGVRIDDFEPTAINGHAGWVASVPPELNFTQLFVNGQRMRRTRHPKQGMFRAQSRGETAADRLDWTVNEAAFEFSEGEIDPDWRNLQDVAIVMPKRWFESHVNIQCVDHAACAVHLDRPVIEGIVDEQGNPARYWIENVFEHMDGPGQFYHDRVNHRLYFLPRFGDRPESAVVIAPRLDYLLCVEGEPFGEKVHDVRFESLDFRHAEYAYPPGYPGPVQAAFTLPGAIALRGAEDCTFYGCRVSQIAQYAIEFRLGCSRNRVIACHLHDLGGGGIKVNHDRGAATPAHEEFVKLSDAPEFGVSIPEGEDPDSLPPQRVTISDCRVHDGGKIFLSAVGVWIGDSAGNRVIHNEIHHMNYSGISCGWTWVHEFDTRTADNLIADNYIHHLNPDELLSDLAGVYTLGPSPGSCLVGNLIHDVKCSFYGDWGLYHDGSSSYFRTEGNAAFRCGYGAMFTNNGRQNLVRRNILINDQSPDNPAMVVGEDTGLLAVTVEENLFVSDAPQVLLHENYQGHVRFRRNVYCNEWSRFGMAARSFLGTMLSHDQWVSAGYGEDERIGRWAITGSSSGVFVVPDDAAFMDDQWREIIARLHDAGPRPWTYALPRFDESCVVHLPPRPAVMPVFELDREMFTGEMHESFVARIMAGPNAPLTGRLRLINRGLVHVDTAVTFCLEPNAAGKVGDVSTTPVSLDAGEETSIPFTVTLVPDAERALLTVRSENDVGFHPVGLFLHENSGEILHERRPDSSSLSKLLLIQ